MHTLQTIEEMTSENIKGLGELGLVCSMHVHFLLQYMIQSIVRLDSDLINSFMNQTICTVIITMIS